MKARPSATLRPHAFTLLEAIIYATIMGFVAVATMGALGRAAVLRGMARTRSEMLFVAQGELDRLRALPPVELAAGTFDAEGEGWPADMRVQVDVADAAGAMRLVRVTVSRELAEGVKSVSLETAVAGGAP